MNDVLKVLYIICFSLAGVCFCASVFIFFKFRIVEVIQDFNGTIAKKQIKVIREQNEHAKNYGAGLLDAGLRKTDGLGRTGQTDWKQIPSITVNNLQNRENGMENSSKNGTVVLQSNRNIHSDFVIIKNIVFVNTSEYL